MLLPGGSVDRTSNAGLAAELANHLTVYNVDRRGRGDSGDTLPYALQREIEDIAAVMEVAGGHAHLYGTSSSAALAMEAAAAGLPVLKLVMWEPPYNIKGRPDLPADTASVYRKLVEDGRRGGAVEYFMSKVVGCRRSSSLERVRLHGGRAETIAHTLAYDATVMGDYTIPRGDGQGGRGADRHLHRRR